MRPILEVARALEIDAKHLEPYGHWKAKLSLESFLGKPRRGKLVLVSAITPTPAGEGKTTTSVGLAQGLAKIGVRSAVALREPSLGPVFGMKGGGAGGGASELVPVSDINMHFNGDFHAISSAHNLLAALVDNHLHFGSPSGLDARRVTWKRVMDMNERALREIIIGLGGRTEGVPRQSGFDITAASEVMAILCLADSIADLKARLGRIVVGYRNDGSPVTATEMGAVGAMAALLRDAVKPNLVQTTEGVPAFVHGGPFANIAHGTNSVASTRAALVHADVVVTEGGFAFDLGAEKFFDINCGYGGFSPACIVLVVTVRALKMHGGTPLPEVSKPDVEAMRHGLVNLERHLESADKFGPKVVVAINHFPTDTEEELTVLSKHCASLGVPVAVAKSFSLGGAGVTELARIVQAELAKVDEPQYTPLYDWNASIETKIATIAREIYGAKGVEYTVKGVRDRKQLEKLGFDKLPICMAKTQYSLSDDATRLGRPADFTITVREIQLAAGAGFIVPITGEILRMPGLPKEPQASRFDLSDEGEIVLNG
ncbi:MAG: formate--tetrahydrofolate ligase [Candidatus Eisenbacteria bacterium]